MTKIQLYDTTLRDGMQGEGMSLSAPEKVRVAHRLDELGIDLIEAGFPSSNPKELELFELLAAERFSNASIAAFGMTRRRENAADQDPALQGPGRLLRARVHARGQDLEPSSGEGGQGRPGGEPAHDLGVDRLPGRPGQAGRLRRRAFLRRLLRRRRLRAVLPARGARRPEPRRSSAATPTAARCPTRCPHAMAAVVDALTPSGVTRRDPLPRRRRLRRGQLARRRPARARRTCRAR